VSDGKQDFEARAVDRLIYFSDAVVAIAITLLAIDLPVPTGDTVPEFWASVRHNGGHYAAFLISFIAISAAWSHHHDIFRYARRMDSRLRTLNTAWLFMIILNPFATKLLTSQGNKNLYVHALRFGFYSLLQVLASVVLLVMLRHMTSHDQAPGIPEPVVTDNNWQTYGLLVGFGLSIPVFFITPYGWVVWFIGPLLVHRLYRLRHGKQRHAGTT
jgi:TMEM175 potassium channel family protein